MKNIRPGTFFSEFYGILLLSNYDKEAAAKYTAILRKVVHATIPKGNMGYDQYTLPDTSCSWRTYFCCFSVALANIRPWPLMQLFQISLKNLSERKTTQNTFHDGRVHFSRQPFSK